MTAEELVFKDENYLPLSELDLRVLVADLQASFERFHLKLPGAQIRRLILTGVNSSHPLIADLLGDLLGLPVVLSRSSPFTGLAGLSTDGLVLQSGLGRLIGLALGLLSKDQLLACSLEGQKLINQDSHHSRDSVAISDLLRSSEAQTGLDLVVVEGSSADIVIENYKDNAEKDSLDVDPEAPTSVSAAVPQNVDVVPNVVDQPANLSDSPASSTEAEESTSLSETPLSLSEASLEDALEENQKGFLTDLEEPPSSSHEAELPLDHESIDDADSSEEQWPSINLSLLTSVEQPPHEISNVSLDISPVNETFRSDEISSSVDDSLPEIEWPSIASMKQVDSTTKHDIESEVQDDASEWLSTSFDHEGEVSDLTVVEDPSASTLAVRDQFEELESDQFEDPIVFKPPIQSEQSNSESSDLSALPDESMAQQREELMIPNLDISQESVQSQQLNDHVHRSDDSDDPDSAEILPDLGELRFAQDD